MAKLRAPKWIDQIRQTYRMTRPIDPAIRWILPVTFVGVSGVLILIGQLAGGWWSLLSVTAVGWGLLATTIVFGRRAEKAAYGQIEGVAGAASEVLKTLRQGWFTTPAIEINRNQEIVHRVIGRAGVILVIEAKPGSQIAKSARQKTERWISDVPLTEIYIGEGQTKLRDLNKRIYKLKKVLKPAEVTDLRRRLEATGTGPSLPIPKGPMPKGMRVPRR
mgnify:CR=1 FL=1